MTPNHDPEPSVLQQGPFNNFNTLADAVAGLLFKAPGTEVYIISEDKFYYWLDDITGFVLQDVDAPPTVGSVPTVGDKDRASAVTSGNSSTTGLTITVTPASNSYVAVLVNGIQQAVGSGIKTKDCYFSADGGTTAKAFGSIVAGDTLYWNGIVTGYDLSGVDFIDLDYNA
jgi:hypothetical protein